MTENEIAEQGYVSVTASIKREGKYVNVKLSEFTDMLLTKDQALALAARLISKASEITDE